MYHRHLLILALIASTFVVACGDDTTANNTTNNVRNENNGVDIPMGSNVLHTGACASRTSCAIDVTFSAEYPLRVQVVDGNKNPIAGARVEFALSANDAAGTTLDSLSSSSDSEGMAEVRIRAGQTTGVAEVVVSVPGDTSITPINFLAAVSPKDSASYRVSFTHEGPANLRDLTVYLYASNVTCDDVAASRAAELDDDPTTNPTLTAIETAAGIVNVDGTLPLVVFPARANGDSFTVAARAKSRDNTEVELAHGCKDGNPAIENGNSVEVVVDLLDYLPQVKGTYDVVHTFAITDTVCMPQADGTFTGVLPSGVCQAVDLIGKLATDPASFLLGDMNSGGVLELIVDTLPDDGVLGGLKTKIQEFLDNSILSGIAGDALNGFIDQWLNNNAPSWVTNSIDITGDIFASLNNFKVGGIIRINKEAVPTIDAQTGQVTGLLEADAEVMPGKQVWEDIIVYWTGDCAADAPESCRERTFSAAQVGAMGSVVEGSFTGSVVPTDDGYGLIIDPHNLSLNYGTLALGIIEKVVFPSMFGPDVDTLDKAIDFILQAAVGGNGDGCQGLADFVVTNVGGGNTVNNLVKNLCGSMLDSASDAIRTYMTDKLVLDSGNGFVLSTDTPCQLSEPEIYSGEWPAKPLPYADKLGNDTMECTWKVTIQAGSKNIDTTAKFNGTRANF